MDIYLFIGSFSSFFRLVWYGASLAQRGGMCTSNAEKQNENIDPGESRVIAVSCFISTNEKRKN